MRHLKIFKVYNNFDLYERDVEILELLSDGYENRQIAEILFVSTHTIKAYISAILKKLKAKNRTQAVCIAMRLGIIK